MRPDSDAPTQILDGIINALKAGMTYTLHRISTERAAAAYTVALSHVYRVRSMAEVKAPSIFTRLEGANLMAWRCGEA
jgi:hypothetical protein